MENKRYPDPKIFTPKNPEKYVGKLPIILRSSWEFHFANIIDNHPNVCFWASESIAIQYIHPIKNKKCNYYPDFVVEFIKSDGTKTIEVIEIKPMQDGMPGTSKRSKNRLFEDSRYAVNVAKWRAAQQYCRQRGFVFKVLTEHQLFGKRGKKY